MHNQPAGLMSVKIGRLLVTRTVKEEVPVQRIIHALNRFVNEDWGDIDDSDWRMNDLALQNGERILASYDIEGCGTIWIISDADRLHTTVLRPSDY